MTQSLNLWLVRGSSLCRGSRYALNSLDPWEVAAIHEVQSPGYYLQRQRAHLDVSNRVLRRRRGSKIFRSVQATEAQTGRVWMTEQFVVRTSAPRLAAADIAGSSSCPLCRRPGAGDKWDACCTAPSLNRASLEGYAFRQVPILRLTAWTRDP